MKEMWFKQRKELQRLAENEGLPPLGVRGTLKDALQFAEMLTLAPNMAATTRLLQEDRSGTLSFLEVVHNLTEAMEDAVQLPSTSPIHGPFHELADFAVEFLNGLREEAPEEFL